MNAIEIEQRHGLPGRLRFHSHPSGLVFADARGDWGTATVCLQGAQVTSWRPAGQSVPVVWCSTAARPQRGKSVRGGVPVCWPWFGPHETAGLPAHGFARNLDWTVGSTASAADGSVELLLQLPPAAVAAEASLAAARAAWPHRYRLELRLRLGDALSLELRTTNVDDRAFVVGEALHTYFTVGDIGSAEVHGLDGCSYVDKTEGGRVREQQGAVRFAAETDRVYAHPAQCTIVDPRLGRRILIAGSGSASTVVWTPWSAKAAALGDFGPGESWRRTFCVESANALDRRVQVEAGATHALAAQYRVEALG